MQRLSLDTKSKLMLQSKEYCSYTCTSTCAKAVYMNRSWACFFHIIKEAFDAKEWLNVPRLNERGSLTLVVTRDVPSVLHHLFSSMTFSWVTY